jgi:hypothetical protein
MMTNDFKNAMSGISGWTSIGKNIRQNYHSSSGAVAMLDKSAQGDLYHGEIRRSSSF